MALPAARSLAAQAPGTAAACSPWYHGATMALTSTSIFLQSFGVPSSTPALGCQGSNHPMGLHGSGAQSRCPYSERPSCEMQSPARDLLRKELPKSGRDGVAEATVPFKGQPHPSPGLTPRCGGIDGATQHGAVALWDRAMVAPWDGAGEGGCACRTHGGHVVVGWQGSRLLSCPATHPKSKSLFALQHHLLSTQLLLTGVFLLWHLHYQWGSSSSMFFAFLPQILGKNI